MAEDTAEESLEESWQALRPQSPSPAAPPEAPPPVATGPTLEEQVEGILRAIQLLGKIRKWEPKFLEELEFFVEIRGISTYAARRKTLKEALEDLRKQFDTVVQSHAEEARRQRERTQQSLETATAEEARLQALIRENK